MLVERNSNKRQTSSLTGLGGSLEDGWGWVGLDESKLVREVLLLNNLEGRLVGGSVDEVGAVAGSVRLPLVGVKTSGVLWGILLPLCLELASDGRGKLRNVIPVGRVGLVALLRNDRKLKPHTPTRES